jgi:recombinational DNA repair ATPase RecF
VSDNLKIIGLRVENFKRIKVFNLAPKSNVIKITGANASGKSSVLDAVELALLGARGGPTNPVRRGAKNGKVVIDLGDFIVTRAWAENAKDAAKGEMWIEAKNGLRYSTPQAMLDDLMGRISFDPMAFMRMTPKQQAEELRRLLDIEEELAKVKADEAEDYKTRRDEDRRRQALVAQRAAIVVAEGLPSKKRDLDAMTQELAEAGNFNIEIDREQRRRDERRGHLDNLKRDITQQKAEIEEMQAKIYEMEAEVADWTKAKEEAEDEIVSWKPLAKPKDASQLGEAIAAARAVNNAIDRRIEAEAKDAEIAALNKTVESLDVAIEKHRKKAAALIANAKYPVEGLGFTEDMVMYQGLPLAQASTAEQIRVCMALGMAGNPKIRIMRIKDGSLLDDAGMKVIEEMVEANDFQCLIEQVDTTGKIGVYLVDGEIAAINEDEPVAKPAPKKRTKKEQVNA